MKTRFGLSSRSSWNPISASSSITTRTTSLSTARRIAFTFTSFDVDSGAAAAGVMAARSGRTAVVTVADAIGAVVSGCVASGAVVAGGTLELRVAGCAFNQAIGSGVCVANVLVGYSDVSNWNRRNATVRSRASPKIANASRASVAARHSASSQKPLVGCCRTTCS